MSACTCFFVTLQTISAGEAVILISGKWTCFLHSGGTLFESRLTPPLSWGFPQFCGKSLLYNFCKERTKQSERGPATSSLFWNHESNKATLNSESKMTAHSLKRPCDVSTDLDASRNASDSCTSDGLRRMNKYLITAAALSEAFNVRVIGSSPTRGTEVSVVTTFTAASAQCTGLTTYSNPY